jgi:hypothetical protein
MNKLQIPEYLLEMFSIYTSKQNAQIQIQNVKNLNVTIASKTDDNDNEDDFDDSYNYIYVLREREFIKTGEFIYKIGKSTKKPFKRFNQYPNGSKLEYMVSVSDCHSIETFLKAHFTTIFIQRRELGTEYFEGDLIKIIKEINNIVYK